MGIGNCIKKAVSRSLNNVPYAITALLATSIKNKLAEKMVERIPGVKKVMDTKKKVENVKKFIGKS